MHRINVACDRGDFKDGSAFIASHRGAPEDDVGRERGLDHGDQRMSAACQRKMSEEALKAIVVREEIDPIQRQQTDRRDSHHLLFPGAPVHDSHPRLPPNEDDRGIEIENDDPAQRSPHERIPSQSRKNISM